jgi:ATP-binding cassette subfamily F protein uup
LPGGTKNLSGATRESSGATKESSGRKPKAKRSFKEEREYAELPARIAALEKEQKDLHAAIASPGFYKEAPDTIKTTMTRVEAIDAELLAAMARWDELDSITKGQEKA